MQNKEYKSLGLSLSFQVPDSVEEFDANAKRAGACLDEAINNIVYRGSLAEFRDTFLTKVEEETGIERTTEEKPSPTKADPNNTTTVYTESEAVYFKRVCAEKGCEPTEFQDLANQVAAAIVFDASAAERKPAGPKKLAKMYLASADEVIAKNAVPKALTKINEALGLSLTPDLTREQLAAAIRDYKQWRDEQVSKELMV